MKTSIFLIFLSTIVLSATAQHNEYIKIYTIQAGIEEKDKAKFVFPNHPDSAKFYNNLKSPDILLGVELMEKKGFETVTINTAAAGPGVIVTVTIMRRKKK